MDRDRPIVVRPSEVVASVTSRCTMCAGFFVVRVGGGPQNVNVDGPDPN